MSPPTSVNIYLIQHVDDPRRHEPRNVGVIVSDSEHVAHILVDPSARTSARALRAVAEVVAADETYTSWLEYWERSLGRGLDGLEEIVTRQSPTFPVILAGEITGQVQDDVAALAQRFFNELVVPAATAPGPREERPIEAVLRLARVTSSPYFKRDYEIPAVGLPVPLPLHFTYAWVNGHVTVADQILAHGGDSKITAVLWKFEHVEKDIRRVALVDHNIDFRSAPLRDYLHTAAQVIRVEDPDAASQLRSAFGLKT